MKTNYKRVLGCSVIHEDFIQRWPDDWRIQKVIEIPGPGVEEDPDGTISRFAIAFKDKKMNCGCVLIHIPIRVVLLTNLLRRLRW